MSVKWTKEQQNVIDLQDRNILVSAAAGSGKTAVLVERIITMLTREEDPVDVDQLLIVTFTEAAAAEMKERIRGAIEKKMEERPDDEHLKQQATLIHSARITTIHSFCLSVIREHFHSIDLDPSFRIGEEGELRLMRQDVLEELLEKKYQEGDAKFLEFAESYARGRDDRKMEELILKLYEFSRSYPAPEEWLGSCVRLYQVTSEEELLKTSAFQAAKQRMDCYVQSAAKLQRQAEKLCLEPDGPYMYGETLESDLENIERFEKAVTYSDYYEAFQKISWKKLAANRDKTVSKEKAEQVKALREEMKGILKNSAGHYFKDNIEEVLRQAALCFPMMKVLAGLTEDFAKAFEERKRSRNMIDFSDMEQYALRILTEKDGDGWKPSAAAREYQEMFREVMIDEYQDSNLIQEAILTSVSGISQGRYNVFMVGDVKQSIYRFRLSRPELFMEKFNTYRLYEGEGTDSEKQRIDLYRNFRSRKEVLEGVNYLFRQIMTEPLGGIVYDDRAAVHPGASFEEQPGNQPEILLIESQIEEEILDMAGEGENTLNARRLEAKAVAGRIRELMSQAVVTDKKDGTLRPVRYSDIVILTRSIKGWSDVFLEVLSEEGIPAYAGTKEGYFETREIGTLLDYFRVLNNRKQDIPLAAVLSSYFGKMNDEELARIKAAYPKERFYDAVEHYRTEGEDEKIRGKLESCLGQMEHFRRRVPYTAIHELLWQILDETGYGDYTAALPAGEQRKANLDMLAEKAMTFESTSYKGLFNFVRYIEQLRKYDVDYGEASLSDEQSDTVRIMSIHKSKGLEFPVVIAAGMGKRFNQQDARSSVIVHASLGVGLDAVDLDEGTKSVSFFKRVMQREEILENLAEELRVLYVALTRAKEKLILTGTMKNPGEKLESLRAVKGGEEELSFGVLSSASSCLSWILPAIAGGGKEMPLQVWIKRLEDFVRAEEEEKTEKIFTKQALKDWNTQETYDKEMKDRLKEQFGYSYPWPDTFGRKLKFTVSELKKREYMKEVYGEEGTELGEMVYEEPEVIPLIPRFRMEEEELTGASRGSAYHRVLELLDFKEDYSLESMAMAVEEMKNSGKIRKDMAQSVRPKEILAFVSGADGRRMKEAAEKGKLWKEQPFVLGVDAEEIYPGSGEGETILVQGIIDVFFEEDGELVVLDYKTDKVRKPEELAEKYHAQLAYYAKALEQLTGKRVKEKIIYSFTLQERILL